MSFRQDLLKTSSRRKNKEFVLKILWGLVFLTVATSIVVFLFYIPAFRITNVAISGLDSDSERELRAEIIGLMDGREWLIIPKNHMVFLDQEKIRDFLANKYRVKDYILEKDFPAGVSVSITERKTWAIWCYADDSHPCLLLDKDGLAFEKAANFTGSAVLKIIDARNEDFLGRNILPVRSFQNIEKFVEETPKYINEEIKTINIKASGETYLLYIKSGVYLIIDSETEVDNAIENLLIALNSKEIKEKRSTLEYLDLRFKDKVFYKFK